VKKPVSYCLFPRIVFLGPPCPEGQIPFKQFTYVDETFRNQRNLPTLSYSEMCRLELSVVGFSEGMPLDLIRSTLTELGRAPATPEHHFALGAQHPNLFADMNLHFRTYASRPRASGLLMGDGSVMGQLLQEERLVILTIGGTVPTGIEDFGVFPAYTFGDAFGSGMNLVGYHKERTFWDQRFLFLTVPA
jgi:hypothetical protein